MNIDLLYISGKGTQPSVTIPGAESAKTPLGEKILLSDLQSFLSGIPTPSCGQVNKLIFSINCHFNYKIVMLSLLFLSEIVLI